MEAAAFQLLEETGVAVQHPEALELLHALGGRVETGRVYLPEQVVRQGMGQVAPLTNVFGRDGQLAYRLGDGGLRFHNSGGIPFTIDLESGTRRLATLSDVVESSRLLDALPSVDWVLPLYGPQDVPASLHHVAALEATLRCTRKPISSGAEHPAEVEFLVDLCAACCGGRMAFRQKPNLLIGISPVSPLTITDKVAGLLLATARAGAGLMLLPAPSLGATGPITIAGAVVQQHAEALAACLIAGAAQPGIPVLYGSRISPIDLRSAVSVWGGPEVGQTGALATALAHRLGLPCDSYGFSTSSASLDPQAGFEKLANALMPALAGVDFLSGVGSLENLMVGSHATILMDHEMISLIHALRQPTAINEETLAGEALSEVIGSDGIFLSHPHTVRQMRRGALWMPGISERDPAGPGIVERARQRARELLQTRVSPALPDSVDREIAEIMTRARHILAHQAV